MGCCQSPTKELKHLITNVAQAALIKVIGDVLNNSEYYQKATKWLGEAFDRLIDHFQASLRFVYGKFLEMLEWIKNKVISIKVAVRNAVNKILKEISNLIDKARALWKSISERDKGKKF